MSKSSHSASDNPLALDNQLCFALYSTSLAMTQAYKKHLEPLRLTYTQYTIMLVLWEQDDVTLKHIADRLGQKSGSLTPVIKRMEVDGLLKRVRGKEDDRALSIVLTTQGNTLKEDGRKVNQCLVESCGISRQEIQGLRQQLVTLRDKIL